MAWTEIAWIMLTIAVASFAQSLSGFGFALVSVPLMTLVVEPKTAVVVSTFVGAVSSLTQAYADRAHADWSVVRRLATASYLGMPLGLVLFVAVSDGVLRLVVGTAVLVAAVLLAKGVALPAGRHAPDWVLGTLSGALATSTSTNGPPLVFVMQARGMEPVAFRATINTIFSFVNVAAIVLFAGAGKVDRDGLLGAAVAVPVLAVSLRLGYSLRRHFHGDRFRKLVLALLVASGASAISASLWG